MRTAAAFLLACAALVGASGSVRADGEPAASTRQSKRTAEQVQNLRKSIIEGLADLKAKVRAAAGDILVAAWPDSAPILDEALAYPAKEVRIEAVHLLGRAELGDVGDRIRGKLADSSESVRRIAVRVMWHAKRPEFEAALVDVVRHDVSWPVRMEALRGLEDGGTTACLRAVLDRWTTEKDASRAIRHRRVLFAVLHADHGEDPAAWRHPVLTAERKAREARGK
jgi:HEAT repeat protein